MLAAFAALLASVACEFRCGDEGARLKSGEYIVREQSCGGPPPDDFWLATDLRGAQLSVDRDLNTATLVYERDGTTYAVRYTLEE